MSEAIKFGTMTAADAAREEHSEHVCPVDDDKRRKTVHFVSDTPEVILDELRLEADQGRAERDESTGQVPLDDDEKEQLDFSETNVLHARSAKGIARSEGVDDWLSFYDPELTVDEHREVYEEASRDEGGRRLDEDDSATEKAGEAAAVAASEECDHARGHCANTDPDACEFLQQTCGFDEDEVEGLMSEPDRATPEDRSSTETSMSDAGEGLSGQELGALKRSWGGYQAAVAQLRDAIEEAREHFVDAQAAAKAINGIRADNDQDPIHFDELETANAATLDAVRMMASDCEECHASHGEHDHGVDDDDVEDLREFVAGGGEATDVGIGEETQQAAADAVDAPTAVAGYELEEADPHNLVWSGGDRRVEVYSHGGEMDHHFSTFVRSVDMSADDPGMVAEETGDRPAAADMGRESNRRRAIDAAVDWMREHPAGDILEMDDQRDLSGDRADDQARLAGGERGEAGQGETVETVEENPGGMMADRRDRDDADSAETEQSQPDAFQVAEGGQKTL